MQGMKDISELASLHEDRFLRNLISAVALTLDFLELKRKIADSVRKYAVW